MTNKSMKHPTILITGGHPSPALAVIEELQKTYPHWKLVWAGRIYAFEGKRIYSSEYTQVQALHIPFINIMTGRLQRSFSLYTIPSLLKFPLGIIQSLGALLKYKPAVVVSFGGYIALPVAVASWILHIPVITHEQVQTVGLANRIIARLAQKVLVTFPETLTHVPQGKGVVTGLPIRSIFFNPPTNPSFPSLSDGLPIIYITGGSTGAQTLNEALFPVIPLLVKTMTVIHQTGEVSFEAAGKLKETLGLSKNRYIIAPFFEAQDVAWIYRHASIVIGRSGANTVGELIALNKKAILIPLPWAGAQEQLENAKYFEKTGNGMYINQTDLNKETLVSAIASVLDKKISSHQKPQQIKSGATNVVREIAAILPSYAH